MAVFILVLVVAIVLFGEPSRSPFVDPAKEPLVEASRAEFAVSSDYETSAFSAIPRAIRGHALSSVPAESVAVLLCRDTQPDPCEPQSAGAKLYKLRHIVRHGREEAEDSFDFVFRRTDRSSWAASQQELRYRTDSAEAVAALVVRPTDWNYRLRRNQVVWLPDFPETDLGEFLSANRDNPKISNWANLAGVETSCAGYCPKPTPSFGERLQAWANTATAYMETDAGRNVVLALCAIMTALAAIVTLLLKRAELRWMKREAQKRASSEDTNPSTAAPPE